MSGMLLLSGRDLARLMAFDDYVEAVTDAFRLHAEGKTTAPAPLHLPVERGGFHVKAARASFDRDVVAFKVNANYPDNRRRHGLPTIQGVVLLCDATNGAPLAICDSQEITSQRTAAATAVAARYLARPDSATATVCGCGQQGQAQLAALRHVLPLERAFAWDIDRDAAAAYARRMSAALGIEVTPAASLREATRASDVVATCTTAHEPYLGSTDLRPGTFVAAVGADNPEKSEIKPELLARAKVVADVLAQCAVMGDLHHAVAAGIMTAADAHAELGELVVGRKVGRTSADEITLFDSTGVGIQDVAAAARAYELARDRGFGTSFDPA